MQAKFASLSIVLSVLFVSQLVGAIPKIDCSLVRCAAVECPLGQTAQIKPGTCCPTCVPCGKVNCPLIACGIVGANLVDSADDYISVTQPGKCCPTCVPPPDCSAVQCLACPEDTVAITVPGQCCPTCKPKPNCKDVLCLDCEDENRSENRSKSSDLNSLQQRNHPHTYAKACRAEPPTRRQGRRSLPTPGYLQNLTYWNWSLSASRWYLSLLVDVWESDCHMGMRGKRDKMEETAPGMYAGTPQIINRWKTLVKPCYLGPRDNEVCGQQVVLVFFTVEEDGPKEWISKSSIPPALPDMAKTP
ncbi:hypothetical protein B0H14DRAFT_2612799 [Mycena olivaceomarginata]|nr:hypothetical protein B0H14DRAFT_2612799 [Mycena olivaceomarginata]